MIEIDNKYNVEKKTKELGVEKARRNLLLTIAAIIVLFSVILAFYYLKLKEANKLTIIQSEQLKNLDVAKSRFFANVSHELRTPLTLMTGTINSLQKEDGLNGKQERMLQIAQRGGKQLEVLVNEILDLGKMDAGKLEVIREPVKLALFFDNYFSQFESLAERKGVQYNFETWVAADVEAKIDKEKCRQIVYNLLSNAFKFTQQGQSVRAIINVENDVLELEVTDTGDGIHPDDQPQIFDRYFQTRQKGTSAMGGTGIGLAICQEYAKLMGGQMKMKSIFGKGTSFRLILPIEISSINKGTTASAPPNVQSAPKSEKSTVKPEPLVSKKTPVISENPTNKPSILIVEDNPELQDYISMVLQDRYHVMTADNGQEALDLINGKWTIDNGQLIHKAMSSTLPENPSVDNFQLSIDLILSDLMMPVMDGYQLLEKLKQNEATSHIPVIMLTARADSTDRLKALRIGVDDYMSKPFDEEELRVRIENLLKNQAVRKDVVKEQAESPQFSKQDNEWLEKFEAYVQENLDSDILDVTKMASDFAMSKSTLLRQLKRLTGLSPKNYLLEMRLNKARLLLENKTYNSIAKIASEVGYKDARSFSKGFKKRFGRLPSEYLAD